MRRICQSWEDCPSARRRRGASAIEFALALPLLLVLIAAVVDYGWYFFTQTMSVYAVREAGREGAMYPEEGDPSGARVATDVVAAAMAEAGVDCTSGSRTCTVVASYDGTAGQRVLVLELRVEYAGLTGIVPLPEAIVSRASAVIEGQSTAGDSTDCPSGQNDCSGVRVPGTGPHRSGGRRSADTGAP